MKVNKSYLYVPKGGMCRGCAFKRMDCSKLNFDKMVVIGVCDQLKLNTVKCDKYQKSGNDKTPS
jgi:hypothetical protein